MILRSELEPGVELRVRDGANITPQEIQHLIQEKADRYGISVGFRQDYTCDSWLEGKLGLLRSEVTALYDPKYGPKSTHYVIKTNTEGTYLFLYYYKHQFCPSKWGSIMNDILAELFA